MGGYTRDMFLKKAVDPEKEKAKVKKEDKQRRKTEKGHKKDSDDEVTG